jgi:hypothetical protein
MWKMPEFKIRIEIFECPPWLYGKIIFPLGELQSIEGRPVIDTGNPDLIFFDCIGRVEQTREVIESVWGDTISDEFILHIVSEKFAGKSRQIFNYSPQFIEGAMENVLLKQATIMFADYYPSRIRNQIKANLYMQSFEWSSSSAD